LAGETEVLGENLPQHHPPSVATFWILPQEATESLYNNS
jgi:hypothetical protein